VSILTWCWYTNGSWPIIVHVGQQVRHFLDNVWLQLSTIVQYNLKNNCTPQITSVTIIITRLESSFSELAATNIYYSTYIVTWRDGPQADLLRHEEEVVPGLSRYRMVNHGPGRRVLQRPGIAV
jgi:hypothetical protein